MIIRVSTHSHPKVAATVGVKSLLQQAEFQHTATRRWLPFIIGNTAPDTLVSTHSHPKVAADSHIVGISYQKRFNTQPPEGGCTPKKSGSFERKVSTHSHPKVAAILTLNTLEQAQVSTHSHPKVAAPYIKKQEKSAN